MPHSLTLITTLAAALGLALAMGLLAVRFKLPPLVGYLLAGIMIGPATPGFVADLELSAQLAEIGVMLLMFGVGLHFSWDDLLAVRRIALPGAVAQITVATLLGMGVARLWDWNVASGVVFGLALSVASTVVLLKALESLGQLETVNGRIAVGWLIVEDLAMVVVLVLLPPLAVSIVGARSVPASASSGRDLIWTLAFTLGQVAAFVGLMLVVGRRVFPKILWHIARSGSRELFTLCTIAAAVGIAFGSAELFGVSFALGAFFAGMVLSESPLSHRAAEESLPLRDAFSVLFFVSVGMLFDPLVLVRQPLQVLATVAIIMIGKSLAACAIVLMFRYPLSTALTVSAGLAQIGEFSFILAGLAVSLKLIPVEAQSFILAGAILSIALNPLLFRAIEPAQAWIRSRSRLAQALERPDDPLAVLPMTVELSRLNGQVVLVGYGRIGRRIGDALTASNIPFVVAEQNREIVEELRAKDMPAVSGDASDPAVLIQAHIHRAGMLVVTAADPVRIRQMIATARTVNPRVEALICVRSEDEAALLQRENPGKIYLADRELARSIIEDLRRHYAGRRARPS